MIDGHSLGEGLLVHRHPTNPILTEGHRPAGELLALNHPTTLTLTEDHSLEEGLQVPNHPLDLDRTTARGHSLGEGRPALDHLLDPVSTQGPSQRGGPLVHEIQWSTTTMMDPLHHGTAQEDPMVAIDPTLPKMTTSGETFDLPMLLNPPARRPRPLIPNLPKPQVQDR